MANTALTVIAVGVGGVAAYYLIKALTAPKSLTGQICAATCGTDKACLAACELASGVIGYVGNDLDDEFGSGREDKWNAEVARRVAVNRSLNGSPTQANPFSGTGLQGHKGNSGETPWANVMQGDDMQYENGCVPFYGSPGWPKCEAGTQDMYASAVYDAKVVSGETPIGEQSLLENIASTSPQGVKWTADDGTPIRPLAPVDKTKMLTGLGGDPTTFGPFGAARADGMHLAATYDAVKIGDESPAFYTQTDEESAIGPYTWYVKGTRVTCPPGLAPKTVLLGANGIVNPDASESCVNPNDLTTVACVNGAAPPGFTWDTTGGAGHWRALGPGEIPFNGPCAPLTGVQGLKTQEGLQTVSNVLNTNTVKIGANGALGMALAG